ncbi:MAG: FecR domain-containing protein [Prevotella sp.]|nr:FecR domain-containing protein [Prevotella sp.]
MKDEQIRKYYQGELSPQERDDLIRKTASDSTLKESFIRYRHLDTLLDWGPRPDDSERAVADFKKFIGKEQQKIRIKTLTNVLLYVSMAASLMFVTWLFAERYFSGQETTRFNTLYVPAGQRVSFRLEDGTTVWLNAQTRLSYPVAFAKRERRVVVEGEAFFEVAKDAGRPFVVSAGDVELRILGTTFNLYNYPQEDFSRISLLEGSLQVLNLSRPLESVTLQPNHELTFQNGQMKLSNITDPNYFLWKNGIYSFDNEPFENILKKLELYYDIHIEVKDTTMLQWRYTVKFRQRDGIDEILRLLQQVHTFQMQINEENNCVTISR